MKKKQIDVILSDYDGTLCSTPSVRNGIGPVGTIPEDLEQILFHISERIPICIISSKDFEFLHSRARFARILSCVLGIETVIHEPHYRDETENYDCISCQVLLTSSHSLMDNSKLLHNIVELLQNHNYEDIMIERKYTSNKEILIGLTIDYRHLENWQSFKENEEPAFKEIIQKTINANIAPNLSSNGRPFMQKYSSHPFLDVYGVECDKGLAFDSVLSHLEEKKEGRINVIYFGDSENDNPAFRKSDISIGIRSDTRLNPLLDCKYMIDFRQLPMFLRGLMDNNYIFSEELLTTG
jgi:HAD superfamily hydrolase (TIGR01484 family)